MAKLSFNKLGLKPNNEIKTFEFNEQIIEVKQYLPVEEKLELINNVLQLSWDENNFPNPMKIQVYTALGIIEKYTNLNFTEKQKENSIKLYDLMYGNGLLTLVLNVIPTHEQNDILNNIEKIIKTIYEYQNSILGILDVISKDYNSIDFDLNSIVQKITDPEALATLKQLANISGLNKNDELE